VFRHVLLPTPPQGPEIFIEDILFNQEHSIVAQSLASRQGKWLTNGDGFGLGWYNSKRPFPGLFKSTLPAWNCANLRSLASHIESKLFFTHVRRATTDVAEVSRPNCHPFVYKNWMFMHNGCIGGYRIIKKDLESLIGEEYYPYRVGATDSEAMFYIAMSFGMQQDPVEAMGKTFAAIWRIMLLRGLGGEDFSASCAASDGIKTWAFRFSINGKSPKRIAPATP
jgi:predicted glutamine amidotransferase